MGMINASEGESTQFTKAVCMSESNATDVFLGSSKASSSWGTSAAISGDLITEGRNEKAEVSCVKLNSSVIEMSRIKKNDAKMWIVCVAHRIQWKSATP
jgi:hypothetical protein